QATFGTAEAQEEDASKNASWVRSSRQRSVRSAVDLQQPSRQRSAGNKIGRVSIRCRKHFVIVDLPRETELSIANEFWVAHCGEVARTAAGYVVARRGSLNDQFLVA